MNGKFEVYPIKINGVERYGCCLKVDNGEVIHICEGDEPIDCRRTADLVKRVAANAPIAEVPGYNMDAFIEVLHKSKIGNMGCDACKNKDEQIISLKTENSRLHREVRFITNRFDEISSVLKVFGDMLTMIAKKSPRSDE